MLIKFDLSFLKANKNYFKKICPSNIVYTKFMAKPFLNAMFTLYQEQVLVEISAILYKGEKTDQQLLQSVFCRR